MHRLDLYSQSMKGQFDCSWLTIVLQLASSATLSSCPERSRHCSVRTIDHLHRLLRKSVCVTREAPTLVVVVGVMHDKSAPRQQEQSPSNRSTRTGLGLRWACIASPGRGAASSPVSWSVPKQRGYPDETTHSLLYIRRAIAEGLGVVAVEQSGSRSAELMYNPAELVSLRQPLTDYLINKCIYQRSSCHWSIAPITK